MLDFWHLTASLDNFDKRVTALNTFLMQERAIAEFRQARTFTGQSTRRVREAVERRIPCLGKDVEELKQRIISAKLEFTRLSETYNEFRDEIRTMRRSVTRTG
jgi:hypothetical protein